MDTSRLTAALADSGVELAYIFGSRARGDERPDSDLDLAILFPRELTTLQRFDRTVALEASLRGLVPYAFDLVVLNDASPLLAFEAVIRGKPAKAYDPGALFRYEQEVRQRYEDFVYSQRFFTAARRQRLGLA